MAEIQVTAGDQDTIRPKVQLKVLTKATWAGTWAPQQYLQPLSAVAACAPGTSQATFGWRYGQIKHEDETAFAQRDPIDLREQFIQIRSTDANGTRAIWTGVVGPEMFQLHATADENPSGLQTIVAYGLEHLLDRISITTARVLFSPGQVSTINWVPVFNERYRRGMAEAGNRSTDVQTADVHVFSDDGAVWTNLDIANYLLTYHVKGSTYYREGDVEFVLSGQYSILDEITGVHRFEGFSVRQALNHLIERQRGLGWTIRTSGSGIVSIHIFSVFGNDVSAGDVTIAANAEQVGIDLDSQIDVEEAIIKAATPTYHAIRVQGARLKCTFSVDVTGGALEKDWTAGEETAYGTATDDERCTDTHEKVFQRFRLSSSWDWETLWGGNTGVAAPRINPDGSVDDSQACQYWNDFKTLLGRFPLDAYDGNGVQMVKPLILVQDPLDGGNYVQVDRPNPLSNLSCGIKLLDDEFGFQLKPNGLNHILGRNHFAGSSMQEVAYDYETMVATLGVVSDERLRVELFAADYQSVVNPRVLELDVPDAEMWYVAPQTIFAVVDGGRATVTGETLGNGGGLLRDDSGRLRTIAALAQAWYGQPRTAVSLTVRRLSELPAVGAYLTGISGSWPRDAIGTVVTRKGWDFSGFATTLETDYWELDVAAIADVPGMSDIRSVGRAINRMQADLTELQQTAARPLERSSGGTPLPRIYEATANESGGEITVQPVESDGTLVGSEITLKVVAE